jgi:hypothetical protein
MVYLIILPIVFVYTAIVWTAVLVVYNLFFEPFDFGALSEFAWKSAILVLVASLVITFIPFGIFASLLVWLIGLMLIFKKDLWECRVLVILIWATYFLVSFAISFLIELMLPKP